jgi:30S ribosomal protein S31
MGKGDKKSRRGKIIIGSFGVRRPRKKKKGIVVPPERKLRKRPQQRKLPKKPEKLM